MNLQKPIRRYNNPIDVLSVHSIFKTIQGEGVLVGVPSIFVRLYGCNLQCPVCDTDYTSVREDLTLDTLIDRIVNLAGSKVRTVVITGGEPFNQDISELVHSLYDKGFTVQIETNGTLFLETLDYSKCIIVCSPKTHYVHKELQKYIHSYKYVGDTSLDDDGLPKSVLGFKTRKRVFRPDKYGIIYLQPLDEKNDEVNSKNLKCVIDSCIINNYRLCLQTHKIIGVE